jgi:hypothetical protein
MKNIFQSIIYSLIGISSIGWISIYLILRSLADPGPDSDIVALFEEYIISGERIENIGFDSFAEVSSNFFTIFYFQMNLILIIITTTMTIGWSVGSHYLNVDTPGKAKFYSIYWLVFSGVFILIVLSIIWYFTGTSAFNASQYISSGGKFLIYLISLIIYVTPYYLGVLLGTARHLRSSVLFANKLPGGF